MTFLSLFSDSTANSPVSKQPFSEGVLWHTGLPQHPFACIFQIQLTYLRGHLRPHSCLPLASRLSLWLAKSLFEGCEISAESLRCLVILNLKNLGEAMELQDHLLALRSLVLRVAENSKGMS